MSILERNDYGGLEPFSPQNGSHRHLPSHDDREMSLLNTNVEASGAKKAPRVSGLTSPHSTVQHRMLGPDRQRRVSRHVSKARKNEAEPIILYGRSFGLISPDNGFRQAIARFTHHRYFEYGVFFLIFLSSLALTFDEQLLSKEPTLRTVLEYMDIITTALFAIEMVLKIITFGLVAHHGAYMQSGWNLLDMFIVMVSLCNLFLGDLEFFKSFRALRALRPLRVISRFQSMRLVVAAIFATLPALANVVLVSGLFFLIFAIIGVQFFSGQCVCVCLPPLHVDAVQCLLHFAYSHYCLRVPRKLHSCLLVMPCVCWSCRAFVGYGVPLFHCDHSCAGRFMRCVPVLDMDPDVVAMLDEVRTHCLLVVHAFCML
jgi:hypothetical protein